MQGSIKSISRSPIPTENRLKEQKLTEVKRRLLDVFGGVTVIRQANYLEGLWFSEEEVIPDHIVIYTSVDLLHPGMENEMFMSEYKEELKREFQQQEIFITISDLQII
jgi:hypothetical protein